MNHVGKLDVLNNPAPVETLKIRKSCRFFSVVPRVCLAMESRKRFANRMIPGFPKATVAHISKALPDRVAGDFFS